MQILNRKHRVEQTVEQIKRSKVKSVLLVCLPTIGVCSYLAFYAMWKGWTIQSVLNI